MIDWKRLRGFDWDAGNARKNVDNHGVTQPEAEQTFFNRPLLLLPDTGHSELEARYHALGKTDDERLLHTTFTLRAKGELIRVISCRDMHRKERVIYEKAQENS